MVTGKNKEQFEKWFNKYAKGIYCLCYTEFGGAMFPDSDHLNDSPFEMQIGVYLSYYDSLGYDCEVYECDKNQWSYDILRNLLEIFNGEIELKTRNEAYNEAFKKADEIINNN